MRSLRSRLLVAATLVLAGFLGATGAALFSAFRDSAETAMRDRLEGYAYALLAAADEDSVGRLQMPQALPDRRFLTPDSGLYALVTGTDGRYLWHSPSLAGQPADFLRVQSPGQRQFHDQTLGDARLLVLNFGISWEDYQGQPLEYTLAVAVDTAPLLDEVEGFRVSLWTWLGGLALILLIAQGGILRWGLRPLQVVCDDLKRIETGMADRLEGGYPLELQGLAGALNTLIASSRANQQRYRNSLDDLAHSMKTPLAILRNAADQRDDPQSFRDTVQEQVSRMDEIVQHQLRRAAASGPTTLGRALDAPAVARRLANSLNKVYQDKPIRVQLVLRPDSRFFGDEADLMELLGNLMDNAYKYGRTQVRVRMAPLPGVPRPGLAIQVEDDGPGIAPERVDEVMQRGRRMDQSIPGQGIGLSMVQEILEVYGGEIQIKASALGGACVQIRFPRD